MGAWDRDEFSRGGAVRLMMFETREPCCKSEGRLIIKNEET